MRLCLSHLVRDDGQRHVRAAAQGKQRQIYFIGNPAVWWWANAVVMAGGLAVVHVLRRHRGLDGDLPPWLDWQWQWPARLCSQVDRALCALLCDAAPGERRGRAPHCCHRGAAPGARALALARPAGSFSHHYLPALLFAIMGSAAVVDHAWDLACFAYERRLASARRRRSRAGLVRRRPRRSCGPRQARCGSGTQCQRARCARGGSRGGRAPAALERAARRDRAPAAGGCGGRCS